MGVNFIFKEWNFLLIGLYLILFIITEFILINKNHKKKIIVNILKNLVILIITLYSTNIILKNKSSDEFLKIIETIFSLTKLGFILIGCFFIIDKIAKNKLRSNYLKYFRYNMYLFTYSILILYKFNIISILAILGLIYLIILQYKINVGIEDVICLEKEDIIILIRIFFLVLHTFFFICFMEDNIINKYLIYTSILIFSSMYIYSKDDKSENNINMYQLDDREISNKDELYDLRKKQLDYIF